MVSETPIADLVEKARWGDHGAFETLVERYRAPLESLVRERLGAQLAQKVGAGDILQETFLQAWRGIGVCRGESHTVFWAWLGKIAERVILQEARKFKAKKRDLRGEVSLQQPVPGVDGGMREMVDLLKKSMTSPSRAVARDERFDRLKRALRQLSPDHRKVLVLAQVKELHTDEVACRMHRSPAAVSMLLYRALLKLKDAFGSTDSFRLPNRRLDEKSSEE